MSLIEIICFYYFLKNVYNLFSFMICNPNYYDYKFHFFKLRIDKHFLNDP